MPDIALSQEIVADPAYPLICFTAFIFSSSGFSPWALRVWPMYLISFILILHLFLFNFKLLYLALFNSCISIWWGSLIESPHTNRSSMMLTTPFRPSIICAMDLWNTSDADEIPKGKWTKQYRPITVFILHGFELSWSSLICQKPWLASRTEKYFVCSILETISSTVSIGSLDLDLWVLCIYKLWTHSVGSVCFAIMLHSLQFLNDSESYRDPPWSMHNRSDLDVSLYVVFFR